MRASFAGLLRDDNLRADALRIAGQHQLKKVAPEVLELAGSPQADSASRKQAVTVAADQRAGNLAGSPGPASRRQRVGAPWRHWTPWWTFKTSRPSARILTGTETDGPSQARATDRLMASSGGALILLRMLDEGKLLAPIKAAVIDRAARHPDANVRVLYEKYLPTDRRPARLGESIKAEKILALKGDPKRGERIFDYGAVQCKSCHVVQGKGGNVGPNLSQIGKKYERKALLETIMEPSKAIAPEYVPHLLETTGGQVYAGFVVERGAGQVVLKDAQGRLVKVPTSEVEALVPQKTSLMPELVFKDVSAQDAADLLAYLTTLTEEVRPVSQFRVLGPFAAEGDGLDHANDPEKSFERPDTAARYPGIDGKPLRWEVVPTENAEGYAALDSVRYDQSRGLRSDAVAHYFLVFLDSNSDQDVTLLLGTDDGCKVWVNGRQIHRNPATRALGFAQDHVKARLNKGRNALVVKVVNGSGPGGISLAVGSSSGVQCKTE